MHELRGAAEPPLDYLLSRLQHCDFPKLEVWRPAVGKPTLWPHWPGIVGVACDAPPATPAAAPARPAPAWFDLADTRAIADFVLGQKYLVLQEKTRR